MKKPHFVSKMRFFKAFSGFYGGDKRDRTADLLNAIQALSQLSYTPIFCFRAALSDSFCIITQKRKMSRVFLKI